MPNRDPVERYRTRKRWQEKHHTPAYNKWLYAKRKLKADKAAVYEALLSDIAREDVFDVAEAATRALDWASERERETGNKFDHEKQQPYYQES